MTDVYARSADSRKSIDEVLKRRDGTINSLISSYDAYEDLLAKSSKGLEFYRKLETNVAKLLQRVKSTCKVQEEEREQILARNSKTNPKVNEYIPDEPVQTGGGLKLKDYLASRQKGVSAAAVPPTYQNPYPTSHVVQSGSPQPLPAVRPAPVGQEGNDAASSLPADSSDPRGYQYPTGYADYYAAQRGVSEVPHAYGNYVDYTAGGLNSSLPKSMTTNTASTYHQANGSTDTTEVTSFVGQYPNYEQSRYPQNLQNQYQYNQSMYSGYTGYSYPEQSSYGVQNLENQPATDKQQFQSGKGVYAESQAPVPPQLSQSQQIAGQIRQYETQNTQIQQSLQQISQNSQVPYAASQQAPHYQTTVVQQPIVSQTHQAIPSQSNETDNNTQAMLSNPVQYPQTQYSAGGVTNNAGQQYGAWSVSSPYPPGVHQNQQGYSNSTTSQHQQMQSQLQSNRGQTSYQDGSGIRQSEANDSAATSQGQNTQVTQSYPDGQQSYGNYQNPYGVSYQPQSTPDPAISQSYASGSYQSHSEMIQSHAKPTTGQSYQSYHPYSVQNQYSNSIQYQDYTQGYQAYASESSVAPQSSDSYKGHPGYTYDPMTGGYQYSSGYQNSQPVLPEANASSVLQQDPAYSNYVPQDKNTQYTIASNNSATNHTPSSQYNQQSYQTPNYDQAYYTQPYGHQGQGETRKILMTNSS